MRDADVLMHDPFAGDDACGVRVLRDQIVTARKGGTCHDCAGAIEPGTRVRVRAEVDEGNMIHFRWCHECCEAMAVYEVDPARLERRISDGHKRRSASRTPTPSRAERGEGA